MTANEKLAYLVAGVSLLLWLVCGILMFRRYDPDVVRKRYEKQAGVTDKDRESLRLDALREALYE